MVANIRSVHARIALFLNKVKFHLFFKRHPRTDEYCNSKVISVLGRRSVRNPGRDYLVFIRCDTRSNLIDDGSTRNFDIALNLYANQSKTVLAPHDYLIVGGVNKYKAAYQFIDPDLLARYTGFIFLDDDLEMTYSDLSGFLRYCEDHKLQMAQPSLTRDSYYSHEHLLNASNKGWRLVDMIEVMCPYFSREALKTVIRTFDLSYSTWGLDYIWPKVLNIKPAVVDEFVIKHTRPVDAKGAFYKYMKTIGVSPAQEAAKLRNTPLGDL